MTTTCVMNLFCNFALLGCNISRITVKYISLQNFFVIFQISVNNQNMSDLKFQRQLK